MIKTISKEKIPKEYAYVLKTKQLEDLLDKNGIDIYVDLLYYTPIKIGAFMETYSVLDVLFWLPNENNSYNRLYVRAYALPKESVHTAREKMTETVLPVLVVWIKNILALPDNSTFFRNNLGFKASFSNNDLLVETYHI